MANISSIRAGASCLPIIGPLVGLYNVVEVEREVTSPSLVTSLDRMRTLTAQTNKTLDELKQSLQDLKARRFGPGGVLGSCSALAVQIDGMNQSIKGLEAQEIAYRDKWLPASQKGRLYAICGVVGNVVSVATVAGLIALGILNMVPGIIAIALFTFQAVVLSCHLYQHNKFITALQTF